MQLTRKKRGIADALAVASGALLSNIAPPAAAVDEDLNLDLSYLEYREHKRVRVREVDIAAKWFYDADNIFTGKMITDAITGSTPSGALIPPGGGSDTLVSPSGVAGASGSGTGGDYRAALVDFVDRRVALSLGWERTYERNLRSSVSGTWSNEDDYQSYGATGGIAWDLNQKLTTLDAGLGMSYDLVSATTGIHKELGNVENDRPDEYEDGEKLTIDIGVGATQVLTRESVVKIGISTGVVRGYLSDPYKVVTLVDENTNLPDKYFHEKRPNKRHRNSINLDYNLERENYDVVSLGYRYFWDDWGIISHTFDVRYRHDLRGAKYLTWHGRWYRQSAADFYYAYLKESENQDPELDDTAPSYASADQRLNEMQSYTAGIKFGTSGSLGDFFIRYEILRQIGADGDYRTLSAQILQAVWTLDFVK